MTAHRLSATGELILLACRRRALTGAEIADRLGDGVSSRGIYVLITRLRQRGLVRSFRRSSARRGRKHQSYLERVYRTSSAGSAAARRAHATRLRVAGGVL